MGCSGQGPPGDVVPFEVFLGTWGESWGARDICILPGNRIPGSLSGRKRSGRSCGDGAGARGGCRAGGGCGWRLPASDSLRVTRKEPARLHLSRQRPAFRITGVDGYHAWSLRRVPGSWCPQCLRPAPLRAKPCPLHPRNARRCGREAAAGCV